ncbi:uncharacterized protein PRCAT00001573001 [Priceomyces carsonii]|uniref:uncharacterized protein n=1 Tax=Priceomyces carsonii TaxID=28549 RepID=UPI002EDB8097|nr:unnamed protein product [Priceomyces carsonii]
MKLGTAASYNAILLFLQITTIKAAPAPQVVTVWQTATQVINTDGSLYTLLDPSAASGNAVTTSSTSSTSSTGVSSSPAETSSSTNVSTGSSRFSSFFSSIDKFLNGLRGDSSSASSSSDTIETKTTSSSDVNPNTVTTSYTSATSSVLYTPTEAETTSSTSSTSESSSYASSSAGIYDAIYESQDIDKTFAKDTLDAHNKYRALHQVGDLSWDVDAYNYAKSNADSYDCSGVLTHTHGPYGENLAAGFSTGPSAVAAWYAEGDSYSYTSANTYDHFTQVIWKGSTKLGCAYKDCSAEGWKKYVICSYDPPGNVIGKNSLNVFPET